jgi:hypothetical protein
MLWFFKYFHRKIQWKKFAFLTQNKAKLCKILSITLVFEKKANFLTKIVENRRKIVIITSTPGVKSYYPIALSLWRKNLSFREYRQKRHSLTVKRRKQSHHFIWPIKSSARESDQLRLTVCYLSRGVSSSIMQLIFFLLMELFFMSLHRYMYVCMYYSGSPPYLLT